MERNRYNRMLYGAKIRRTSREVLNCKNDKKKLYNLVSNITGRVKDNPLPPRKANTELANSFGDFFIKKITNIRDNLKHIPNYVPPSRDVPVLEHFHKMSCDDVQKVISSMASKTCEMDVIPTKLLKLLLGDLIKVITDIVDLSLESGLFHSDWKTAIV